MDAIQTEKVKTYMENNAYSDMYVVPKIFGKGDLLIKFFYREQIRNYQQGFLAFVDSRNWNKNTSDTHSEVEKWLIENKGVIDEDEYIPELDGDFDIWKQNEFPKIDLEYGGVCHYDTAFLEKSNL